MILKDHAGGCHHVVLPPDTREVYGITLSGDEILICPVYCDPMFQTRMNDFFDGAWRLVYEDDKWIDKEILEVEEEKI